MENRFSRFFERILVFSTIVSLMLTVTSIFSTVINNYEVDRVLIDWFSYLIIIASGIIITIVLQIFTLEKIKPAMHIVFIVFYLLILLVVCYFTGKTNAPYVLLVLTAIQYFLQAGINELFIFHDKFTADCENFEGKELEQHLFHNNLSAIDLTEKIKGQQAIMFALSVVMFIVLVFGKLSEGHFTPLTTVLVAIFYISVLFCCFMLSIFQNDIFYAFLGFKNYISHGKKLVGAVLLIAAVSGGAAAVISSDTPLIKIKYVEEYKESKENKPQIMSEMNYLNLPDFEPVNDDFYGKESKPSWLIDLIFELIKYAAIIALIGGALYFFIKPFFTRHFRVFWSEGRLFKFLRELWHDFIDFLKYIFAKSPDLSNKYSTVQSKKFHDTMMDFLKKTKRSKEKIEEIDRLTKHFMRLIDFGQSQGIKYTQTLAPAEYTALFKMSAANKAGLLFEKALYDKNTLSSEEEKEFIDNVNCVISEYQGNQE